MRLYLFLLASPLLLAACGGRDDVDPVPTEAPASHEAPAATDSAGFAGIADLHLFARALRAGGWADSLGAGGPVTVFAPTDAAFATLPTSEREALFAPAGRERLRRLLADHVIPVPVRSADVVEPITYTTLGGITLTVALDGDSLTVSDAEGQRARVRAADVDFEGGVLHTIDRPLGLAR
ncbi:MAG TPA: fasciclin domain-containing protein [Rubricoccaceae bacterium]|nr:fasciclin domain-containing protein [Rubricoccaceae bacterium]